MARLDASNEVIVNLVRQEAGLDYQSRIPATTQANLAETLNQIRDYQPFWNLFQSTLLNKIALTVIDKNMTFDNRLRPMKRGSLTNGGMVEDLDINLIKAQQYDPDDTNVFNAPRADVAAQFYRINRRNKYKLAINEDLLAEAFVTPGGLAQYINMQMATITQSGEWDEYKLMLELLGYYQTSGTGFYNVHVDDITTATDPESVGKQITQKIREVYEYTKGFYRTEFNQMGRNAYSNRLMLLVTPKVKSYLDVYVLANAFNVDFACFLSDYTVTVDEFPAPLAGTAAILVDAEQFYRVWDTKRRMVNIFNPDSLDWIYTLHIWQILNCSMAANAIRFSTAANTGTIGEVAGKVATSITVTAADDTFNPGDVIPIGATVTYSDGSKDAAAYYIITAADGTGTSTRVTPDTGTYIDELGNLHVGANALWSTLSVTAVATATQTVKATVDLTKAVSA